MHSFFFKCARRAPLVLGCLTQLLVSARSGLEVVCVWGGGVILFDEALKGGDREGGGSPT